MSKQIVSCIAKQVDAVVEDMIREAIRSEISQRITSQSTARATVDLKQIIHDRVKQYMDNGMFDELVKEIRG